MKITVLLTWWFFLLGQDPGLIFCKISGITQQCSNPNLYTYGAAVDRVAFHSPEVGTAGVLNGVTRLLRAVFGYGFVISCLPRIKCK